MSFQKYLFFITLYSGIFILLFFEAYGGVLVIVLFYLFAHLVLKNRKYDYMVRYIERFF